MQLLHRMKYDLMANTVYHTNFKINPKNDQIRSDCFTHHNNEICKALYVDLNTS